MKSILKTTLFSFLFLFLSSCSKSEDSKPADDTDSAKFIKFKCNGTLYEFNDPDVINSLSKSIFQFLFLPRKASKFNSIKKRGGELGGRGELLSIFQISNLKMWAGDFDWFCCG